MRRVLALTLAAVAILVGAPAALAQDAPPSPAERAALEKAYDEAVVAARASLPVFWERLAENPVAGPDDFQLKVEFRNASGGSEDLWLSDIKRDGKRIVGRLNYDPETLPNLHRTDILPIREADIIDWTFKEGRKRYGHFTTRVIAKAHPEEAAKTMALLSDNPLPADARGK